MEENSTIYDYAFKTLFYYCDELIIPVINEMFGTKYSQDDKIIFLSGEFVEDVEKNLDKTGETLLADSILEIFPGSGEESKKYHIKCQSTKCQSTKGKQMLLRIFEYSTQAALLEPLEMDSSQMTVKFPRSAILYLISTATTPNFMTVNIEVEDKKIPIMQMPVMKVKDYSVEQIFEKDLFFLIPFYLVVIENRLKDINSEEEDEQREREYNFIDEKLNQSAKEGKFRYIYRAEIKECLNKVAKYLGFEKFRAEMAKEQERLYYMIANEPENNCEKKFFAIVKHAIKENKSYTEHSENLAIQDLFKAGFSHAEISDTLEKYSLLVRDKSEIEKNIQAVAEKNKINSKGSAR